MIAKPGVRTFDVRRPAEHNELTQGSLDLRCCWTVACSEAVSAGRLRFLRAAARGGNLPSIFIFRIEGRLRCRLCSMVFRTGFRTKIKAAALRSQISPATV